MTSLLLSFMAERAQFSCREIQAVAFSGWRNLGPNLFEGGRGASRMGSILQHVFVFRLADKQLRLTI